ncbi:uncharacterized protein DNG_05410 [Cephalotrichum gorgonifer]|uniref:Uncharacterized protein n=1 Tax=Cephalotrichum gorgonifer TaxID=2041049 RepID=A0AAE8MYA3_9PEZI|nr:uncharacterized protein DNG_05410 [Cephalotrichum gorgonifer]
MDDATRLIANLQDKLAELDQKVATYRQDLADEFTRHSHQLLRDLPESLSATVQGTIARSVHKHRWYGHEHHCNRYIPPRRSRGLVSRIPVTSTRNATTFAATSSTFPSPYPPFSPGWHRRPRPYVRFS